MAEDMVFETRFFGGDEYLLVQGERTGEAYRLIEGKVRVFLSRDGRVVDLAELGPGEIIGEMSLLTDDVNAANVKAIDTVKVEVITSPQLIEIIRQSDPLVQELIKQLVNRVRSTDSALLKSETREYMEIDFA
ncbi:MAG: cyclic nucleotide-binding domain-containing protein [Alphaproteobacteria bacterium]|nr:cyclic nucleotide-binding domain-containing protein [Alphaproteobacteria bacterium]